MYNIKTLRQIKNYDTINVQVSLDEIMNYFSEEIKTKGDNIFLQVYCPLSEGVIRNDADINGRDSISYMYFEEHNDSILVQYYVYDRETYDFRWILTTKIYEFYDSKSAKFDIIDFDKEVYKGYDKATLKKKSTIMVSIFQKLLSYVVYIKDNPVIKMHRNRSKDKTIKWIDEPIKKEENIKSKATFKLGEKVVYETNINKDLYKNFRKYNQRHTESWSVMGHKRTYKNGKVIYVQPYTKGSGTKKKHEYIANEK